jgi:hypothetical protein
LHCEAPLPAKARTSSLSLNIHRWTTSHVRHGLRDRVCVHLLTISTEAPHEASSELYPLSRTERRLDDYFRFQAKPPLGDVGT